MCPTGKIAYSSFCAAYRMVSKKGQRLRAYRCPTCGDFHATSHYQATGTKEFKRRKMELRAA